MLWIFSVKRRKVPRFWPERRGWQNRQDIFPNFKDAATESRYSRADIAPQGQEFAELFHRFAAADQEYVEVYTGFANGAYLSSLDSVTLHPIAP